MTDRDNRITVGDLKKIIKDIADDEEVTLEIGGDESSYGQLFTAYKAELNTDALGLLITSEQEDYS